MQHIETPYGILSYETIAREVTFAEGELAGVETTLATVKTMAQQFEVSNEQLKQIEAAIAAVADTKRAIQKARNMFAGEEQSGATHAPNPDC